MMAWVSSNAAKYTSTVRNIINLPDCQWAEEDGELANWYLWGWPRGLEVYDHANTRHRLKLSRWIARLRRGEELRFPNPDTGGTQRLRLAPWA